MKKTLLFLAFVACNTTQITAYAAEIPLVADNTNQHEPIINNGADTIDLLTSTLNTGSFTAMSQTNASAMDSNFTAVVNLFSYPENLQPYFNGSFNNFSFTSAATLPYQSLPHLIMLTVTALTALAAGLHNKPKHMVW